MSRTAAQVVAAGGGGVVVAVCLHMKPWFLSEHIVFVCDVVIVVVFT